MDSSKKVFYWFNEICKIPHGSGNTGKIADFCVEFAKSRNLICHRDKHNNVIIIKEASKGHENAEPIILQGHLDMVCEKTESKVMDFEHTGISIINDGKFIYADGTTLGGDDGIAIAIMLAILDSDTIIHPKLEVIMTSDEEIGMIGATNIDLSCITGRRMINIDWEKEGQLTVGCAGGVNAKCSIPLSFAKVTNIAHLVKISNLAGGHSGMEIDKNRANANKLMAEIFADTDIKIISFNGGEKSNVIPTSCESRIIANEHEIEQIKMNFDVAISKFANENPKLQITTLDNAEYICADSESSKNIISFINSLPNGVMAYSKDIDKLVETSLNMGSATISDGHFYAVSLIRSSVESEKEALKSRLNEISQKYNGAARFSGEYPAWEINNKSELTKTMQKAYLECYGYEPELCAIHAGLECGIISQKLDELECVSIGPNLFDIHTVNERMEIESVERLWTYLLTLLRVM